MDIRIQVKGVDELARNLRDLGVNRIPNYVARGLTAIADQAQDAMIQETRSQLTVRGTWLQKGTKFGINRKAATKSDLSATVSSSARWLVAEETEAQRVPVSNAGSHPYAGGMNLAIPMPSVRPSRLTDVPIPRALMPRNLARRFVVKSRKGSLILMRRVGKGRISGMVPMYVLAKSAPIPKRIHLLDHARMLVGKVAPSVMSGMVRTAINEGKA